MLSRWWQATRRRPVVVLLLLLVSTTATAVSVSGPLLVRAVQQSATAGAVADADLRDRSVVVSADLTDEPFSTASGRTRYVLELAAAGLAGPWSEPVVAFRSTDNLTWADRSGAELASRWATADDGCRSYALTSGHCPDAGEVLLPSTDQARAGRRAGEVVDVSRGVERPVRLTVAGFYDPTRSPEAPLVRPSTTAGVLAFVTADPLVVAEATAQDALGGRGRVVGRLELQPGLGQDDKATVRAGLEQLQLRLVAQDVVYTLDTGVPQLLDTVDTQLGWSRVLVLVSALQGLGLALLTLVVMTAQLARVRTPEWGIGRLQGVSTARWWAAVYLEPLLPLLLGVPARLAVADGLARRVVARQLLPGTPVELGRPPVLLAAGLAGAVAVGALVLVTLPVLRRPLAELVQQRAEATRPGRLALVVQVVVVLLAAVTGYQVGAGGGLAADGGSLGLLAPGLVALAAAMVAVRVAALGVRRATRTRPRGVAGLVVGRRIARIPSALQPSLVVAVAVALAVLSGQVAALSVRNQDLRADAAVGARTVLQVSGAADADGLVAAVARADPSARYAMAAEEVRGESVGGTSRIVAVGTDRFAAVTRWHLDWGGVPDLPATLAGQQAEPLVLRGREVRVGLADVRVQNPDPAQRSVDPSLALTVEVPGRWVTVGLGSLSTPGGGLGGRLPSACRTGCRLVRLTVQTPSEVAYRASFTLARLRTDGLPTATTDGWLRNPTYWRSAAVDLVADAPGRATPLVGPDGLAVAADSIQGEIPVTVRAGDLPDPVPALLGPAVATPPVVGAPGAVAGTGFDGQAVLLTRVGTAAVLPRSLGDGVLVDLRAMAGAADPLLSAASSEVWLADDAPADLPERLAAAGLTVTGRQDLGPERDRLRTQAMTVGAGLAGTVGVAGLALALIALVAGRVVGAEQRRADWRVVARAGVGAGRLRTLAAVEVGGPALGAVLLGATTGLVFVLLTARRLPLVDLDAYGPPLDLRPDLAGLAWVVIGAVLAVAGVAVTSALLETRPER